MIEKVFDFTVIVYPFDPFHDLITLRAAITIYFNFRNIIVRAVDIGIK